MTFREQIQSLSDKAAKVTTTLSRLMANVGKPTASKRQFLMTVAVKKRPLVKDYYVRRETKEKKKSKAQKWRQPTEANYEVLF